MPYHHLALAVRDMKAVHDFYTRAMGFELVRAEIATTPTGGRARHYFYDTGDGEMMAFWELDDPEMPREFPTGISTAAGLPDWVNHIAFRARDLAELEAIRRRWTGLGLEVVEIDHHWCRSIYAKDPSGNLVEFCVTTGPVEDRDRARRALAGDPLDPDPRPRISVHRPDAG